MKRILAIAFLLAASSAAPASNFDLLCEKVGARAEGIMEAHQLEVPIGKSMAIASTRLWKQLVMKAYDGPRYSTKQHRDRAIARFRDDIQLACYKDPTQFLKD